MSSSNLKQSLADYLEEADVKCEEQRLPRYDDPSRQALDEMNFIIGQQDMIRAVEHFLENYDDDQ